MSLFNACHQAQYQKNLIERFKEKFKIVKFGPKNAPFNLIWVNKTFPKKMSSLTSICLLNPHFKQKIRKKYCANPEETALPHR